jgi:hypothetical protein
MVEKPTPVIHSCLIADSVFAQAQTGKWCIIGAFTQIHCPNFPTMLPSLGLFLSLTDVPLGEHDVRVVFLDSNRRQLAMGPRAHIKVTDRLAQVDFGIQTQGLPLPHAGSYLFEVQFDDQPIGDAKITVNVMPILPQGGNT